MPYTSQENLLKSVVADTTGESFVVGDRIKMSIQFIGSGIAQTGGSGIFTLEVSNDDINWIQYNRLVDNVTNSNVQSDTKVASVTINADGSKIYFFPEGDHFEYIRAKVDFTTAGVYTAVLHTVIS